MRQGQHHTQESIKKMSFAKTGRKLSLEHRAKLSLIKTGPGNHRYGVLMSEETKEKIRRTKIGRKLNPEHRLKALAALRRLDGHSWNCGLKLTSEQRKNMGKGNLGKKASWATRLKLMDTHAGERHYNWKGGITPLVRKIRRGSRYRQWREIIFKRDDFVCCVCHKQGGQLEADHFPDSFSKIFHEHKISDFETAMADQDLWKIENGRTTCKKCHRKTHRERPLRFIGKFTEQDLLNSPT